MSAPEASYDVSSSDIHSDVNTPESLCNLSSPETSCYKSYREEIDEEELRRYGVAS